MKAPAVAYGAVVVWKFKLGSWGASVSRTDVSMPEHARVLRVGAQQGVPVLWAEVVPEARQELRRFILVGTGFPVPPEGTYLGTFEIDWFVGHVYEVSQVSER